jgi:hypothetical protein
MSNIAIDDLGPAETNAVGEFNLKGVLYEKTIGGENYTGFCTG